MIHSSPDIDIPRVYQMGLSERLAKRDQPSPTTVGTRLAQNATARPW
jgi:hypothetical protein